MALPYYCLLLAFLATDVTDAGTVLVSKFEWTINPVTIRVGAESDVRVRVNVTSSNISDNIGRGKGLWRVGIFGSQNRYGQGEKYDYRPQVLGRKAQGRPLRRSHKLIFDVQTKFNLRELGPTTSFPFMCLEFTQGDSPRPPFTLIIESTNFITSCQMTPADQDVTDAVTVRVSQFEWTINPLSSTIKAETNVRVRVNVTSSRYSDNMGKGVGLWRVGIFGSQNQYGHGPKHGYIPQVLRRKDQGRPLRRGRKLVYDVETKFNLRGLGQNSAYPYMCLEFTQGEYPRPPFTLIIKRTDIIVSCQMTPTQVEDDVTGEPPPESIKSAIFTGIRWDVYYQPSQLQTFSATPIRIILTVGVDRNSDSIQGENLWRVDIFASHNQDGSGEKFFHKEQILSERYQSMSLDNTARTLTFSIVSEIEYYGINCHPNDPSYFCIELSKGENPNFYIPIYGDDGLRNCQAIECKAPGGPQAAQNGQDGRRENGRGLPQAVISSLGWSTDNYAVSRSEPSRMNMRVSIVPSPSSDTISGTGLWELIVFGSEHPQGSGPRYNQIRNILNSIQESQTLYPNAPLNFDVEFYFMMGQIGCDGVNYFCVELVKGSRARPDFEIPSTTGHNLIRKCQERACPFPVGSGERALMTNIRFSMSATKVVTVTISTNSNSDRIEGHDLWRVGIFGSQNQDGSGRRRNEVQNILSDDATSKTLVPGRDMVLSGNANIDLQGIGTGQDYPYICMEFAKGDHPNPDFDLPMQGSSIISCSSIAGTPVDDGTPRARLRGFSSMYELGRKYQDGTTALTVRATVTPDSSSDPISGHRLWKLGVFGSSNQDGTGRRYPVSPQILRPPDPDQPLNPNRDMEFEVTDNVDLRAIGPGTDYPYLCVEFSKDPNASPDYDLELGGADSVIVCQELRGTGVTDGHGGPGHGGPGHGGPGHGGPGHGGPGHGGPGHRGPGHGGRPRALVSQFGYELGTKPVPESHLTNVSLTTQVTPFESTDTITGRDLWRVGIFGSSNPDGEGPRMGEVRQLLSPRERAKTLESGSTLMLHGETISDLRGIGGPEFPYLCVEFDKANPNGHFDFPVQNPSGTLLSCRPYQPHSGGDDGEDGGHGDEPDKPSAIFSRFSASISPSAISDSHLTRVEVEATATPHDQTDYIPAAELRLGMFGSDRPDGTVRVNEVRQLLPRGYTHPVYSGRPVDMDVTSDIDLRGIGVGTEYPYLCVEFDRKNDHVDFDMPSGPMVACNHYTPPEEAHPTEPDPDRPQVYVSNMRTSMSFSQVPESKLLETTVGMEVTSHGSSDYIPPGTNWRLGIFGNPEADGSGRRKKEVRQLLARDQQRHSWAPGETINFEAVEQLDLNGIGIGTNNPYLCLELDKANDHVSFDMPQGPMVSCSEFDNPGPHIGPEPEPEPGPEPEPEPEPTPDERPRVIVLSVTPDKGVKAKEKATSDITFDVVVAVDPSSDQVHGDDLWVLTVFVSKKKNGNGPRLGEVEQTLSQEQQSQTIQKRKKIPFRDVSMTMDLTGVKCKDVKYLCVEIAKGTGANFELESTVIGCQKMKCAKKSKKGDTSKPRAETTLTISSIEPSKVSVFQNNLYSVEFTAPIEFDASQSEPLTRGINLWKMSAWFNKDPSDSKQNALIEQVLQRNKKSKYVTDPSVTFSFGRFEVEMDLRGLNCKKLKYFCVKLTPDEPQPPFTLAKATQNSNIGCKRTMCR